MVSSDWPLINCGTRVSPAIKPATPTKSQKSLLPKNNKSIPKIIEKNTVIVILTFFNKINLEFESDIFSADNCRIISNYILNRNRIK
jgi:hypothetical protein